MCAKQCDNTAPKQKLSAESKSSGCLKRQKLFFSLLQSPEELCFLLCFIRGWLEATRGQLTCQWPCLTALKSGTTPRRLGCATAAPCSRSSRHTSSFPRPAAAVRAVGERRRVSRQQCEGAQNARRPRLPTPRGKTNQENGTGQSNFFRENTDLWLRACLTRPFTTCP